VLEDQGKSTEAKADMIASATRHIIETEMAKDPAFYTRFSKLLGDVLAALEGKRIQAIEALGKIKDIATKVATHTEDDTPSELVGNDMARRFFGCLREDVEKYTVGKPDPAARVALAVVERIKHHKIRDWRENQDALNGMRGEIDDIFYEVCKEFNIQLPLEMQDKLIDACIEVARANED
jgi:type I restriction enzyme R subunit